jgi:hypothetical protein
MQNNAIYIFKESEKNKLGILTNGKKHTFFYVLLQILFNYL